VLCLPVGLSRRLLSAEPEGKTARVTNIVLIVITLRAKILQASKIIR
jgi:hypothetical protein